MSNLYVPPAEKIVRRVAVGKAPRPAGADGIAAAAEDAHAALLLAPWEVSEKAPHMPVHEYARAIPDGDAWKAVYGYDATARTLRVACGAVCYSFPIPPDAMSEDSEADPPVSPALVESLAVRVIGDRYLDQGARVYVTFTEADEPPSVAAFVAVGAAGVAASAVVCATASQEVPPNDRTGLRAEAEIDYGANPASPASYCHVCLALADYDAARGAWVEGGAQLDLESLGVTFDRDVSDAEPEQNSVVEVIADLDLGMTTDTPPSGETLPTNAGDWTPDRSMDTSSVSRGQYSYHIYNTGDTGDLWSEQDAWGYWYIDSPIGRTDAAVVKKFLTEITLGRGDGMHGSSHLPSFDGPTAGNLGYGIITTYGHESYAISALSRSGFVSPGEWHALVFNSSLPAMCDLRVVLLGGYVTKRYTAGNVAWSEIKPTFESVLSLLQGDGKLALIPPSGESRPEDDMLSLLAVVDVKRGEILKQIAFDAPVSTDARYPNLFTIFAAVFPFGVGGGSYPNSGTSIEHANNSIMVQSLFLKDENHAAWDGANNGEPTATSDVGWGAIKCTLKYIASTTNATHTLTYGYEAQNRATFNNPQRKKIFHIQLNVVYDHADRQDNFKTGSYTYFKKASGGGIDKITATGKYYFKPFSFNYVYVLCWENLGDNKSALPQNGWYMDWNSNCCVTGGTSQKFYRQLTLCFDSDDGTFHKEISKTCELEIDINTFISNSPPLSFGEAYDNAYQAITFVGERLDGAGFYPRVYLSLQKTTFSATETYSIDNPADSTTFEPGEVSLVRYKNAADATTIIDAPAEEPADPEPEIEVTP